MALRLSQAPAPTLRRIAELLSPYLLGTEVPAELFSGLSAYLDLLLHWNARTNLTAIRDPEQIVQRHFGESLFAGSHLAERIQADATLLDFGSGAGFPGLPIQLLLPSLRVTLAESQGKKAAFLREAVRTLHLSTVIWPNRVESLPLEQQFDAVALRAVDNMKQAVTAARTRVVPGGWLMLLDSVPGLSTKSYQIPGSNVPGSLHNCLAFEQL